MTEQNPTPDQNQQLFEMTFTATAEVRDKDGNLKETTTGESTTMLVPGEVLDELGIPRPQDPNKEK